MKKSKELERIKKLVYLGIIVSQVDPISKKCELIITCQKCGYVWRIKNIKKLPKTCVKCKGDPYKEPAKRGRPKK